jgi:uncharacterized protein with PQ loop repeat
MLPLNDDDDGGCALADYNPTIEKYFHDCIYDTRDLIGFYFGLISISCWLYVAIPQLITNYRRQSAEALSPFFLAQWLLGDTCNLLGALLKGDQPETVILTAQYFICMDVVLLLQYLYFSAVSRRRERTYVLAAEARRHRRHHHHHHHHSTTIHTNRNLQQQQHSSDITGIHGEEEDRGAANTTTIIVVEASNSGNNSSGNRLINALSSTTTVGISLTTVACSLIGILFVVENKASPSPSSAARTSFSTLSIKEWQQSTGSILGYISCILYLASRISQILKNNSRKSAEGLSSSMFICAVTANLFYGTSVLLRARTAEELISSLPWVLGSLGTVALDGIILTQTVVFGKEERKTRGGALSGSSATVDMSSDIEQPLLDGIAAG